MNTKINTLLATLDEEVTCYRAFQQILADEEQSMSLANKARFDMVQHEKGSVVNQLQQFEQRRITLMRQLSETYATGSQPMTVSQLAQFLKPPFKENLLTRAWRLRSILSDVHEKNQRNQTLIHHYLKLVKGSLKILSDLIEDRSVYPKPGVTQSTVGYPTGGGRLIRGSV